jgi:hypothetical protein
MHKALNKAEQIGAELVVRTLEMQGVTHVFGVPGAKIDSVFNALVDSKIETVVCRHEQNAAFIAGGIGRMTGKAGVAIATSGPGVSNLTTGLATANSGRPVVALGGTRCHLRSAEAKIHQTMDAVAILKPVTKFSATVERRINSARCWPTPSGRPDPAGRVHRMSICPRTSWPNLAHTNRWRRPPSPASARLMEPRSERPRALSTPHRTRWCFWECWPASRPTLAHFRPSLAKTTCRSSAPSEQQARWRDICSIISAAGLASSPASRPIGSRIR